MSDVGKFYIDENQHLIELIEWSDRKVRFHDWTLNMVVGWDKIIWVLSSQKYTVVPEENIELAKKIYA